jgi:hypothetical protein
LSSSTNGSSKLKSWIEAVLTLPFGKYTGLDFKTIKPNYVKTFLDNLQKIMDSAVWGHEEPKRQIIQIIGQQIRNPTSKGNVIGIWGPAGNGKTSLIKEGIAKAMNRPFIFISLGGASDASFLEGHSYTYEGSIYGRIANGLIECGSMNPIIYFDELDKISKTHKGQEITNLLVHLTDPVQNNHFRDKYFHNIDLDLSRATFIFSYNDPSLVDPILSDRITQIETKFLLLNQKIHIGSNYLLSAILKEVGLQEKDIIINDELLQIIITEYTREGGVRKLKSILYNIVRELNIANLTKSKLNNNTINFPYNVSIDDIKLIEGEELIISRSIIKLNMEWFGRIDLKKLIAHKNISVGNANLRQSFTNRFSFNYNSFKVMKSKYVQLSGSFSNTNDAIATASNIDSFGKSVNQYVNVTGNYNYGAMFYYGFDLYKGINFGTSAGINGGRYNNIVNGIQNTNDNISSRLSVELSYWGDKKINFWSNFEASNNKTVSSIRPGASTNFWSYRNNSNLQFKFKKAKFFIDLSTDITVYQKSVAFPSQRNIFLVHPSMRKVISKNDKWEAKLMIYDIFNQNQFVDRNITSNFISETANNGIRRYALFSIIYNFSKNGKPVSMGW